MTHAVATGLGVSAAERGAAPKPGLAMRYAGRHRLDEIDRVDCCVIHNQICSMRTT